MAYYSYGRLARDADLIRYSPVAPELMFEILSPSDRWSDVRDKAAECLAAGVEIVCVLNPIHRAATLLRPDAPPQMLGEEESLPLTPLPDWAVTVAELLGPPPRIVLV